MMLFLGLGRMGLPMAEHVLHAGAEIVAYDPSDARMNLFTEAGGNVVTDLSSGLMEARSIVIMAGTEAQVADIFSRAGGIFASCSAGTLVLNISTVAPEFLHSLGERAKSHGIRVVDAPVCRAEAAAKSGTLLAFLSGAKDDCDEAIELMRPYCSDFHYVGSRLGAAQVAKTVNNLILWATVVANYEGLELATSWQLDIESLRRALTTSSADNWALRHWDRSGEWPWSIKDMQIAMIIAKGAGVELPLSEKVEQLVRKVKVLNHA